jgi:hypothetical protein
MSAAVQRPPLPSSAGQVCTGHAIVNQVDPFLPRCPITSRYNVIPATYNGRLRADSSHQLLVGQTTDRIWRLLTGRGLRKRKSLNEGTTQSLRWRRIRPVFEYYSYPFVGFRPDAEPLHSNQRFCEVTNAMSFLWKRIEVPHVSLDSNLTDQTTLTSRTYNP